MSIRQWLRNLTRDPVKPVATKSRVVLVGDFRALLVARLGDVVFIECEGPVGDKAFEHCQALLTEALKPAGVRAVIIPYGLHVVRAEKDSNEAAQEV